MGIPPFPVLLHKRKPSIVANVAKKMIEAPRSIIKQIRNRESLGGSLVATFLYLTRIYNCFVTASLTWEPWYITRSYGSTIDNG
jgi:hypothetical protein